MSKLVETIPLQDIAKLQLYINTKRLTLAAIKAETGADYILNGGLYDMTRWKANCQLKADGYVYAQDAYSYWGFAWDEGADIGMCILPQAGKRNGIACVELLRCNKPQAKLLYTSAQGGKRGRTAIGLAGERLCLYVSSDGSTNASTPEQLRDELASLGWTDAIMLDGGGSSQCDFKGKRIASSRVVHNLILVYLKKGTDIPMNDKKKTVCLDPGHGPGTVNGSPDGTYLECEFCWDIYQRLKPMLEAQGVNVIATRGERDKPSLTDRCKISNAANADLFVSLHSNAAGGSGWSDAAGLIVFTSSAGVNAARNVAAQALLKRFQSGGVALRGTGLAHNMELTVLAKTNAPACLIEYGFHTNRGDVALLRDAAYRDKLAKATVQGICDYLGIVQQESRPPDAPWYEADRAFVMAEGISDGTRPNDSLTRAEAWAMLHRAMDGKDGAV